MADDKTGRFLYDMVAARMAAQTADQSALVSRAKDLLAVATITVTVGGALVNTQLFDKSRFSHRLRVVLIIVVVSALVTSVLTAMYTMKPRVWYLSADPHEIFTTVSRHEAWTTDNFYASVANGFVEYDVVVTGMSALVYNDRQIERLRTAVLIQMASLGVLSLAGAYLTYRALFT